MPVIWPPTLPQYPLLEGYEETAPDIVLRSNNDAGPPKVRRRFTANVGQIACRYNVTRAQLDIFDDFYFGPAGGGSVAFEWMHPWRRVTVRVRFKEAPRYSSAGNPETAWMISVALEVLPPGMPA